MYSVLVKILLSAGWILFVAACVGSSALRHLEWRDEAIAYFVGPLMMFAGLIVRYWTSSHSASRPSRNRLNQSTRGAGLKE